MVELRKGGFSLIDPSIRTNPQSPGPLSYTPGTLIPPSICMYAARLGRRVLLRQAGVRFRRAWVKIAASDDGNLIHAACEENTMAVCVPAWWGEWWDRRG